MKGGSHFNFWVLGLKRLKGDAELKRKSSINIVQAEMIEGVLYV